MIEEQLLNFGVLGIWTVFNISTILYYRKKDDANDGDLKTIINNNTIVMTRMCELMRGCVNRNGS